MALQIGQVVQGVALYPARRGAGQGDEAANDPALPRSGQDAPPLTGLGGRPLSGAALQALQGAPSAQDRPRGEETSGSGKGEAGKSETGKSDANGLLKGAEGKDDAASEDGAAVPGQELNDEQKEQVRKLKARDQEVRRHEAAHAAAGGQFAGSPSFSYEQGPDGQRYAVGGEVSIDTSPVDGDPEATARKADQIRRAALAPADPSSQDQAVAAAAAQMKAQAQAEAAAQRQAEAQGGDEAGAPAGPQAGPQSGPKPPGAKDEAETAKVEIVGPKFGTARAEADEAKPGSGESGEARRRSEAAEAYGRSNVIAFGAKDDRRKGETSGLSLVA
jgi:hypothetical protein